MAQGGSKSGGAKVPASSKSNNSSKIKKQNKTGGRPTQKKKTPKDALTRSTQNTKNTLVKSVAASIEQEMMQKMRKEGKPMFVLNKTLKKNSTNNNSNSGGSKSSNNNSKSSNNNNKSKKK